MDPAYQRQTDRGIMCQECAFKYQVEKSRMANPIAAPQTTAAAGDNLLLGLAIGFFCGILGLILVFVLNKGEATRRGALFGFAIQATVYIFYMLLARR